MKQCSWEVALEKRRWFSTSQPYVHFVQIPAVRSALKLKLLFELLFSICIYKWLTRKYLHLGFRFVPSIRWCFRVWCTRQLIAATHNRHALWLAGSTLIFSFKVYIQCGFYFIFQRFCAIVNLNIECTFHGSWVAFETAYCQNTVDFALCILVLHVCWRRCWSADSAERWRRGRWTFQHEGVDLSVCFSWQSLKLINKPLKQHDWNIFLLIFL